MEDKKLVPKKIFREHKDDSEWSYFNWKDTVDISKNMVDPRNEEYSDLPHIGPGNIKSFTGLLLNNINTVKEDNLISGKFHFNTGDIVYGKINPQLGKYTYALYEGLASADTYILNSKNGLEQRFLFMLLQTKHFFNYSVSVSKRSGMPKINRDELNEYTFCAPTKEEQQKIGAFFKVLDERIANQERKIAKVKALKAAYLTEMFPQEGETVPKRRFKGFEGEWNETILDSVLAYEQPTDYIVDEDSYDDSYDIPVLTAGQSFLLGYTNEKHGIKKANVNNSVIIFDDFTTSSHHVDFFFKVKSSALKILSSNSRKYSTYFAYLILKNIDYTPESHERHWISIFSNFEVMTPSMEEQQKIGAFFKNLDNQIETEEKKLDKLQKMKEAYLEEMFV